MTYRNLISIGAISLISFFIWGCGGGKTNFDSGSTEATNPVFGEVEKCVVGQKLRIFLDPVSTGTISPENYLGEVVSYSGIATAFDNYNYYSASAHPIIGPSPIGFETNVFFYQDSEGIHLNFFANIDEGGSSDNQIDIDITALAEDTDPRVILSDDSSELNEVSEDFFEARFQYWNNTDGGVIGPFSPDEKFQIQFKFIGSGDITSARFYSANDNSFSLANSNRQVNSFIIENQSFENCD